MGGGGVNDPTHPNLMRKSKVFFYELVVLLVIHMKTEKNKHEGLT